jgi:hypothetical protein
MVASDRKHLSHSEMVLTVGLPLRIPDDPFITYVTQFCKTVLTPQTVSVAFEYVIPSLCGWKAKQRA